MLADHTEQTILILAPVGQDAPTMAAVLQAQGISTRICLDPVECLRQLLTGAGALLLTEEALELPRAPELLEALKVQPPWSELPLIILTSGGESRLARLLDLAASAAGSATLLERPMSIPTLLRSVQVALRSRRRQYLVRDLIAERERSTEALRESEERFRILADGTPVIIWVHDAVGGLRFINEAYRRFFGATVDQVAADNWQQLVHPDDVSNYVDVFLECHAERRRFQGQARVRRYDGQWRWLESIGAPRFSSTGEYLGMAGSSVDITERKEAEAVLERSKDELERLVAERTAKLHELVGELEHFSYTITHDMRAPLRSMRGFAELVLELSRPGQTAEQIALLRRIVTSAERMDLLITDALSYSQAVRQHLPLGPVDTGLLLRGMLDSYPEFQCANARIQLDGEIPLVLGNQAGLTQVFSNLIGNAIKFTKPGQTPHIRIWAETVLTPEPAPEQIAADAASAIENHLPPEPCIRIWVEDDGIGIPPKMLPRIFHMFTRGSVEYEGSGIGLALVRKVVDRMGGRVGVLSQEGKGSRFWVELLPGDRRQIAGQFLRMASPGPGAVL